MQVPGGGTDECVTNAECITPTHFECQSQACVQVTGAGTDECTANAECTAPTHTECQNQQCITVSGAGTNQCQANQDCTIASVCGNGAVEQNEECDGNLMCQEGYNCESCKCVEMPVACGNGIIQEGEDCDVENICSEGFECKDCKCIKKEAVCGNGLCEYLEDKTNCQADCDKCMEIYDGYNNPSANRANIIFAAFEVDSIKDKAKQALDLDEKTLGLFSIEPFKSNKNKFNFWYVDKKYASSNEALSDEAKKEIERICNYSNTYSYYIAKDIDNFMPLGTAGQGPGNKATIRWYKDDPDPQTNTIISTVIHESGHLIGRLKDEYVLATGNGSIFDQGEYKLDESLVERNIFFDWESYKNNGKTTEEECLQKTHWKSLIGSGCGNPAVVDCIEWHLKWAFVTDESAAQTSYAKIVGADVNFTMPEKIDSLSAIYYGENALKITSACESKDGKNWFCSISNTTAAILSLIVNGERTELNSNLRLSGGAIKCKEGMPDCIIEISCFEGALYKQYDVFRPTFNSIMNELINRQRGQYSFGKVNEQLIQSELDKYSSS